MAQPLTASQPAQGEERHNADPGQDGHDLLEVLDLHVIRLVHTRHERQQDEDYGREDDREEGPRADLVHRVVVGRALRVGGAWGGEGRTGLALCGVGGRAWPCGCLRVWGGGESI